MDRLKVNARSTSATLGQGQAQDALKSVTLSPRDSPLFMGCRVTSADFFTGAMRATDQSLAVLRDARNTHLAVREQVTASSYYPLETSRNQKNSQKQAVANSADQKRKSALAAQQSAGKRK